MVPANGFVRERETKRDVNEVTFGSSQSFLKYAISRTRLSLSLSQPITGTIARSERSMRHLRGVLFPPWLFSGVERDFPRFHFRCTLAHFFPRASHDCPRKGNLVRSRSLRISPCLYQETVSASSPPCTREARVHRGLERRDHRCIIDRVREPLKPKSRPSRGPQGGTVTVTLVLILRYPDPVCCLAAVVVSSIDAVERGITVSGSLRRRSVATQGVQLRAKQKKEVEERRRVGGRQAEPTRS